MASTQTSPHTTRSGPLIRAVRVAALVCLAVGLLSTGLFVVAQVDQTVASSAATRAFFQYTQMAVAEAPDQSLWSASRQTEFLESLKAELGAPDALLDVPSIGLTVPVFRGTSELALNRGAGWIEGTAAVGADGNIGLAGHRDGFFRGLKDLEVGDALDLRTVAGSRRYRVTELLVVDPQDVFVLDPTPEASVTLVTCYPFYFVGHAPQRFIVRGVLEGAEPASASAGG